MNITQFDKQNLVEVRAALNEALAQVTRAYGVKFEVEKITYSDTSFKCVVQAVIAQTVTDPYLTGVRAAHVNEFNRFKFSEKLLAKVKTHPTSPTYVLVGKHGHNLLGKLEGQPNGGLYQLEFKNGNYLYCQVLHLTYNKDFDASRNKFGRSNLPDLGARV